MPFSLYYYCIGIVLGLALGAIPFSIPGISTPVKLGLAGGPIIVGILLGTFGPRIHMITYTTRSANPNTIPINITTKLGSFKLLTALPSTFSTF